MTEKTVTLKNSKQETKTIEVNYIARVEGRGALNISVTKEGKVQDLRFRIYEPPRFFEAFLVGRRYTEMMELSSLWNLPSGSSNHRFASCRKCNWA